MTEEKQAQMLDKITALLAKAESTTPEEAELLTEKAQQLMEKYAIDQAMLAMAQGLKIQEKIIEDHVPLGKSIYMPAHISLGHRIGVACGCKTLQSTYQSRGTLYLVGYESDVARAKLLLASLMIQAAQALQAHNKAGGVPAYLTAMEKFKNRRSFLFGFADAIGKRLHTANEAARAEAEAQYDKRPPAQEAAGVPAEDEAPPTMSVALVLKSRQQNVKDWYDQKYGTLKGRRGRGYDIGQGYGAGQRAGHNANVGNPGVSGSKGALGR